MDRGTDGTGRTRHSQASARWPNSAPACQGVPRGHLRTDRSWGHPATGQAPPDGRDHLGLHGVTCGHKETLAGAGAMGTRHVPQQRAAQQGKGVRTPDGAKRGSPEAEPECHRGVHLCGTQGIEPVSQSESRGNSQALRLVSAQRRVRGPRGRHEGLQARPQDKRPLTRCGPLEASPLHIPRVLGCTKG